MKKSSRRAFLRTLGTATAAAVCMKSAWGDKPVVIQPARSKLRLVFYTDIHTRLEWNTPLALEMAAEKINQCRPDLVIAGGDLITDGFQSSASTVEPRWRAYMKMHQAIRAPVHVVIGNHDLVAAIPEDGSPPSPDPKRIFLEKFGLSQTHRSFTAAGYHFILLDPIIVTGGEEKYHGMIHGEQMEWLKQDLSRISASTPIIVVTHIPLMTGFYQATRGATTPAPANRVVQNNREVLDLFQNHNLILVLQGHLHVDEMLRWRKTTFITGGAICGKWWRGPWFGTEEGFGQIEMEDNLIDWKYVNYGWETQRS